MPPDPMTPSSAPTGDPEVTRLLAAIDAGDRQAAADLLPLVYEQLRVLARSRMGHVPPGNTLQPTALVHEAFMRLVGDTAGGTSKPAWQGRGHFFGAAAQAMRDILVEQARRKGRLKAGGDRRRENLDGVDAGTPEISTPTGALGVADDMLALNDALRKLEADDPRKASAVLLKYFAGLEHDAIAGILGVSVPTVDRDLRFARVWLAREMKRSV
jgi:RNA polymerase sigma factor (TIGR02999 family)